MYDKKLHIIKEAMTLFATKGYHATSIQEIADHCHISKGSVYLHFTKKEEILLEIYKHYHEKLTDQLKPLDRLDKHIEVYFAFFLRERDFILLLTSRNEIDNQKLQHFFSIIKKKSLERFTRLFIDMFGLDVKPHITDLTVITEGILHAYLQILIYNDNVSISSLSTYTVSRIEDIVAGLLKKGESPQLTEQHMLVTDISSENQVLMTLLKELEDRIERAGATADQKEIYDQSLQILKEEVCKKKPNKVIIKGMLANLNDIEHIEQISQDLFDIIDT